MPKFKIYATRTINYELVVEAKDEEDAYRSMDDMISDDFKPYETTGGWDFIYEEVGEDAEVSS